MVTEATFTSKDSVPKVHSLILVSTRLRKDSTSLCKFSQRPLAREPEQILLPFFSLLLLLWRLESFKDSCNTGLSSGLLSFCLYSCNSHLWKQAYFYFSYLFRQTSASIFFYPFWPLAGGISPFPYFHCFRHTRDSFLSHFPLYW